MARTVKSSTSTQKSVKPKKRYIGWEYTVLREQYNNSIGIYRCDRSVEGGEMCPEHCEKCKDYYR